MTEKSVHDRERPRTDLVSSSSSEEFSSAVLGNSMDASSEPAFGRIFCVPAFLANWMFSVVSFGTYYDTELHHTREIIWRKTRVDFFSVERTPFLKKEVWREHWRNFCFELSLNHQSQTSFLHLSGKSVGSRFGENTGESSVLSSRCIMEVRLPSYISLCEISHHKKMPPP